MRKLRFQYEMKWLMDQDVWEHHFILRCRPMEREGQKCLEFSCRTEPAVPLTTVVDGFGNQGLSGSYHESHDHLCVWAEGMVLVDEGKQTDYHPMYRFPTVYTAGDENLQQFFLQWKENCADILSVRERLKLLMETLAQRVVYTPGATSVKTTAAESFAMGKGVCQDYAHIMIALCRMEGLSARYVAGLMPGEGATHAWVEVWAEEQWIGFDPTHRCLTDDSYIKLTHGRDFADASIDRGCFLGAPCQTQEIYVKVEEVF